MIEDGRLFLDVAALSEEVADTVIPNGETWEVRRFQGIAAYLDDTAACLIWDPSGSNDLLGCTHGDTVLDFAFSCVGDGVKVLRISLQNDTNTARVLGAQWEARKL